MTQPTPRPTDGAPDDTTGKTTSTSFTAWLRALRVYREPASLRMLSLGFSAGLPLALVFGTFFFWLREAGVDRTTIGYLSWEGMVSS